MVLLKRWLLAFGVMLGSSFCVSHGVLALMLRLLLLLALFARGKVDIEQYRLRISGDDTIFAYVSADSGCMSCVGPR